MTNEKPTEKQTYKFQYKIDHGVSHGFGIVYDDQTNETKSVSATSTIDALIQADEHAKDIADNWLCNTKGKVTVRVEQAYDPQGQPINILEELTKAVPTGERFEQFKKYRFPDGKTLTIERTYLDHIIDHTLKNKELTE